MNALTSIPSVDAIGDLPLSVRQALVPDLMRYSQTEPARNYGARLDEPNARLALNLNENTGGERDRRFWFTSRNDVHPVVRGLYDAVVAGTFTLSDTAPTPTEGKSRAQVGDALAVMRRREAQAIADRQAAEARVAALEEQMRHLRPSGASTPWGPEHPDWRAFWLQAAMDAERAGNCSEYDRHADEMGAPTRADFRREGVDLDAVRYYQHTIRVRLSFDVTLTDEAGASNTGTSEVVDAIREAINNDAIDVHYALDNWEVTDSEPDENSAPETVWSNPGRS